MPVILGLDVGSRKVGIALSDESAMLATPHSTVERNGRKAENAILKLIKELGIKTVVVGLPYSTSGERTPICREIENFCRRLMKRANIRVEYMDESLTTVEAEAKLRESGKRIGDMRKKGMLDAAAAAIILQSYLNLKDTD
ncbi:MAG: Holliday junction resolvase RuvX [Candidatus Dadabacteria bacterium]|nr:MAG: Holliday junction resolvase RuvX [Candidatus Dadabacteria bacterium]